MVMSEKLRYAYYPGCAAQEIAKETNTSTRAVAQKLGIELLDMPGANCCGAGLLTDFDKDLTVVMNARIFAQAEAMGMDILTICSTCLMVMSTMNTRMAEEPGLLDRVNGRLAEVGLHYSGNVKIKQLLWVLVDDYGLSRLRKEVVRPIDWFKVGPFYGCHSLRPSDSVNFDDPLNPRSLEDTIRALGGTPVDYAGKTKCCGFQVDLVNEDNAAEMIGLRLNDAKGKGAECIVTPCPLCHINLDSYQNITEKKISMKIGLPVFHLSQLVGLAIGIDENALGFGRHIVSGEGLLGRAGKI